MADSRVDQGEEWLFVEVARISTGGDAYTIKIEENYCYISCGYGGFRIFDISNTSSPIEVAHVPQPASGYAHQFIMHNKIAFIGNGYGGIWILNCTNPEAPNTIIEYNHDYSWDIQLNGDILYAGNGHIVPQESITVTNISDITQPVHVRTILTDDDITDLQRVNQLLYAASSTKGFLIFDISSQTNPFYLGNYTDPLNPDIYLVSFDIIDEYAFVVYYQYGLKVLNISDPTNITLVTEIIDETVDYYSIHVLKNVAYISNINHGIQLINVSDPTDLEIIVDYSYPNCGTNDILPQEDLLFVADRNIGFLIFNVTKQVKLVTSTSEVTTTDVSSISSPTNGTTSFPPLWFFIICGLFFSHWKKRDL